MMRHRTRPAAALALLLVVLAGRALGAQSGRPLESDVKAAYLFHFGQFIRWPADATTGLGAFGVCVLGQDPFGAVLDSTLAGENIDGRRVVARRIETAGEATGCHILFVSASERARVPAILKALSHAPVLTVSDIPGFIDRGGMIQFVTVANRVRFEVNTAATASARLMPSSELARVAVAVRRGPVAE